MFNGKTKSLKYIIEKVFRDTGDADGLDIYDCIEWSAECMELIGAPSSYEDKIASIDIEDGRGVLPCDVHLITQLRAVNGNSYVAMRYATDTFHRLVKCDGSLNISSTDSPTYTVSDDAVFTNFQTGVVQMAYKGFKTDENGWPMVPDDIKFIKAVEWYIREKIDHKSWRAGKLPQAVYEKTVQESCWYLGAAQTRGKMPSIDQMENLKNNMLRLVKKIDQHGDFFGSLGNSEKRTMGRTNRSNLSTGTNEISRNDFQDFLDSI